VPGLLRLEGTRRLPWWLTEHRLMQVIETGQVGWPSVRDMAIVATWSSVRRSFESRQRALDLGEAPKEECRAQAWNGPRDEHLVDPSRVGLTALIRAAAIDFAA
jgi:hypothetical protein